MRFTNFLKSDKITKGVLNTIMLALDDLISFKRSRDAALEKGDYLDRDYITYRNKYVSTVNKIERYYDRYGKDAVKTILNESGNSSYINLLP